MASVTSDLQLTFLTTRHHRPLASITSHYLASAVHACELAQSHPAIMRQLWVEPMTRC